MCICQLFKVMLMLPVLQGGECSDKVRGLGTKHHLHSHFVSIRLMPL